MKTKIILAVLIAACLAGAAASVLAFHDYSMSTWFSLGGVLLINAACARYLYGKAQSNKVEWGLFGFLGNLNAVLIFWLVRDVRRRWGKGHQYFS